MPLKNWLRAKVVGYSVFGGGLYGRGFLMKRFVEGVDRRQSILFPDRLEDWIGEDNPVRAIDVFIDELDLGGLGFGRVAPRTTGRPGYHPSVLLKLYV